MFPSSLMSTSTSSILGNCQVRKRNLSIERKSGTSSVREIGSTRMELGLIERRGLGIGRRRVLTKSFQWSYLARTTSSFMVLRRLLFSTRVGLLKASRLIGSCMNIAFLIRLPTSPPPPTTTTN
ncbi:hypothetical protein LINPERPRIM_LOCUS14154 [Linum perenne]